MRRASFYGFIGSLGIARNTLADRLRRLEQTPGATGSRLPKRARPG
jgi:hypothetical protein